MKIKKIIKTIIFIFIVFLGFNTRVSAFSFECDKKDVLKGEYVTCIVTDIDSVNGETINIFSNLEIYESNSSIPIKKDTKIKFSTRKATDNSYDIYAESNINGKKTITINIKDITTTKTTTSTTKVKSNNNYLSYISINGEEIKDFSKENTKYFVSVPYDTNKIKITTKTEDNNAIYEINGPDLLEIGDNEYTIGVTSEDNTIRFYKIIIHRNEEEKKISTRVSNIKIKGYKLNFDGQSKTYHLKVKENVKKLEIKVKLEDNNAKYEIDGNEELKDGSIIKIIVENEDLETSEYRIIISKEETQNYLIYLIIGLSIIILIIVVAFILSNKKNHRVNKKLENEKDNENLEKTIKITNISGEKIIKETKTESSFNGKELEKTKNNDLKNELDKVFEDTFNN